jgi:Stage II sporulation protein E (SpoIIE)
MSLRIFASRLALGNRGTLSHRGAGEWGAATYLLRSTLHHSAIRPWSILAPCPRILTIANIHSLLEQDSSSPGEILERVNETLVDRIPPNMFVTCFYAIQTTRCFFGPLTQ